uniref:Protein tyrosine phosphatase n=1 Tax=Panagrolaimus sp. ES5 TaxID=591445 RepID=A0AC34F9W8_9BILA
MHGNYVLNPDGEKIFLATQGPLKTTTGTFWKMLIQEQSTLIVMLCQCEEQKYDEKKKKLIMAPKSTQYWPSDIKTPLFFDNLQISAKRIQKITYQMGNRQESIVKTDIEIIDKNSKEFIHKCLHIQYKNWKDLSIPDMAEPVMDICIKFVLPSLKASKPVTVHCSAGIGRTGAFIATIYCFELFIKNQLVKIPNAVKMLRAQRHGAVQTFPQYLFMQMVLMELIEYSCEVKLGAAKATIKSAMDRQKSKQKK